MNRVQKIQSDDIPIDPEDPELADTLHKEANEGNVVAQWRLALGGI